MPVFTPHQDAALTAASNWLKGARGRASIFRLFGYAGTGKTTLVKHIAEGVDGKVLFAAFTGKAHGNRRADAVAREQQPDHPPAPLADAGADRQGDRRLRRELAAHRRRQRSALRARIVVRLRPGPGLRRSRRRSSRSTPPTTWSIRRRSALLEKEITRVPKGRAIMIPLSDKTAGHGTHTLAAVWKQLPGRVAELTEAPDCARARAERDPRVSAVRAWRRATSRRALASPPACNR